MTIRTLKRWGTLGLVAITVVLLLAGCTQGTQAKGSSPANDTGSSREASETVARRFVQDEATFRFDGMAETFKVISAKPSGDGWVFEFGFDSRQSGYGDRTGLMLAQVITPHVAKVVVGKGQVKSAIMDGKWDMLQQKLLK